MIDHPHQNQHSQFVDQQPSSPDNSARTSSSDSTQSSQQAAPEPDNQSTDSTPAVQTSSPAATDTDQDLQDLQDSLPRRSFVALQHENEKIWYVERDNVNLPHQNLEPAADSSDLPSMTGGSGLMMSALKVDSQNKISMDQLDIVGALAQEYAHLNEQAKPRASFVDSDPDFAFGDMTPAGSNIAMSAEHVGGQQMIERFEPVELLSPSPEFYLKQLPSLIDEELSAPSKVMQFKAAQKAASPQALNQLRNESLRYEPMELVFASPEGPAAQCCNAKAAPADTAKTTADAAAVTTNPDLESSEFSYSLPVSMFARSNQDSNQESEQANPNFAHTATASMADGAGLPSTSALGANSSAAETALSTQYTQTDGSAHTPNLAQHSPLSQHKSAQLSTMTNDSPDQDPNKGLINVNSFTGKTHKRGSASQSVRVTSKKAALAHQDDHVPASNPDCVAPDLQSARQAAANQRLKNQDAGKTGIAPNSSLEQLISAQNLDLKTLKDGAKAAKHKKAQNAHKEPDQPAQGAVPFAPKTTPVDPNQPYSEPFAHYESSNNAIYLPQPFSSIHKITEEELQEEQAKDLAYERAIHRASLRTEMDEDTLRNNPMLLTLLSNGEATRRILPAGHQPSMHPKKDLIENVKHGTSIFPFACYVWVPQNYSYRVALHWHPEVELVRFNRGVFKISIDMQDTIIEDNAFMLLPGNIMHTFTMPPNCEESALVFDPHMLFLQNYDEVQSEILEALISGNMPLPPIITPDHKCFAKIDSLYSYCVEHGATTNASHRLMIKAKLLEILAIYHEHGLISRKEVHTNIKRSKQDKLKELLNYIDSHYAGPITIKDASNRLGVTDQYFCRFFKRVTGMSFTEYLNDLRLRRAAKEIELTNRAISDIAYEHGFENVGYFFKSFKNKFSLTPLKYRKRHLASLQNK